MNKTEMLNHLDIYRSNLRYEEKARNSIDAYVRYAKAFINFIDHENNITKDDVLDFKDYLINVVEYSASSTNTIIVYVNKFFYALSPEICSGNHFGGIII